MRMHVAIVMPGAHGHINPTLAVTRALVAQGARVSYLYTPLPTLEAKLIDAEVRATGAEVHTYASRYQFKKDGETPEQSWAAFPRRMLEDSLEIAERVEGVLKTLRPDVLVHDFLSLAGRFAGHALELPTLTFHPTYPTNEHFPQHNIVPVHPDVEHPDRVAFRALAQQASARWGVPAFTDDAMYVPSSILNVVFMPRAFHPAGASFDERYVFVGPSFGERLRSGVTLPLEDRSRPLYYVSLGTTFSKQPAFFKLCLEVLGALPCRAVVSIGDRFDPALLGAIPSNATVASFVDQLDVLPACSAFVTHGGMNSVMEALYYGVPMVIVPQIPEQVFTAKWLAKSGLGVPLDLRTVSAETLERALLGAATDDARKERVRAMSATVRATGGYEEAARAILAQASR